MTMYDEIYTGGEGERLEHHRRRHEQSWRHIAWQDAYAYLGECLAAAHPGPPLTSSTGTDDGHPLVAYPGRTN